jgi:hypothetical protein
VFDPVASGVSAIGIYASFSGVVPYRKEREEDIAYFFGRIDK